MAAKTSTLCLTVAAASYAVYAGRTWLRYGKVAREQKEPPDQFLEAFIPVFDVVDRHHVRVAAPPKLTMAAATRLDLDSSGLIRGIFKARACLMGAAAAQSSGPRGLLAQAKSFGWGILAESENEFVLGAATKPWEPNPKFQAIPSDEFLSFNEPGFVKIVWTIRVDPDGDSRSVLRTETRAVATDAEARRKFRLYWSFLSPGIIVIRRVMLPAIRNEAQTRWTTVRDERQDS